MHIAQPALSRQIQALERQIGAPLFVRDRRSVALTPTGRQLLEDATPLLASADAVRRRAHRASRGASRLTVGFRAGIIPTAAVRRFAAEHPDASVDVVRLEWDDQEDALLSGRVDIAYVRPPIRDDGLKLTSLYVEQRLVALPADHRLAQCETLLVEDLAGEHHLRYLQSVRADHDAATVLRSVEEKLEYVAGGHGIILLPRSATEHYTRPDIVYVAVTDAEPDPVLLAHESTRRSKLISAFSRAVLASTPTP